MNTGAESTFQNSLKGCHTDTNNVTYLSEFSNVVDNCLTDHCSCLSSKITCELHAFCVSKEAIQPNMWGKIHNSPYVSNKNFGHICTNTTNMYGTVGNKAIVYNECLNGAGGSMNHHKFTLQSLKTLTLGTSVGTFLIMDQHNFLL